MSAPIIIVVVGLAIACVMVCRMLWPVRFIPPKGSAFYEVVLNRLGKARTEKINKLAGVLARDAGTRKSKRDDVVTFRLATYYSVGMKMYSRLLKEEKNWNQKNPKR